MYVRTPHTGNEFKVCNEQTDETIAIFFSQEAAVNYIELRKVLNTLLGEIEFDGGASQKTVEKANQLLNQINK